MDKKTEQNVAVLANAVELATAIIVAVSGEAVSNTIDGKQIPAATLKSSVTATIQRTLAQDNGAI